MNFAKTVAAIALATASLAAQATPISQSPTFTSVVNPNPDTALSSAWNKNGTANFTFNLGTAYDTSKYDIDSASIVFNFGNIDYYDVFKLTLGSSSNTIYSWDLTSSSLKLELVNTLPDLQADGKISGSISMIYGDILFKDATLTANYSLKPQTPTTPTNPVPEPASLALIGLGLGALAMRRRKG